MEAELTHFAHEGVEALPMLVAVEQQLPHVTLHRKQTQVAGAHHRSRSKCCLLGLCAL